MEPNKLAVCAVFRDEAAYLLEWIAYHLVAGVDHFVLYDNDSSDGGAALIRNSPLAERVTLIHWPQRPGKLSAYRHFIDIFAPGFEWAAFLDLEDFLLPLDGGRIGDTLDRLESAAAVLVNWRVFGPGAWDAPPPGLVIENYDLRAPDDWPMNHTVRSIARCVDLLDVSQSPHEFQISGTTCNTLGAAVPNVVLQETACHQGLVINRYHTRSRQDWVARVQRDHGMLDAAPAENDLGLVDRLGAVCRVRDETIKAFVPGVRALLGLQATPAAASAETVDATPAAASFAAAPAAAAEVAAETASATPPSEAAPTEAPTAAVVTVSAADAPPPVAEAPAAAPPHPATTRFAAPAPGWVACGPDAQQRDDALAMIFRDRSRQGAPWLAALRGAATSLIDPQFLLDEAGRIHDFADDAAARVACEAALSDR
jgi:hypothetical protein